MKNKELIVDNGKLTREGWEEKTWKQVVDIRNGKNQKKVENPSGKYPIYGSGGIFGYADEFLCPENTTIIGRKGSINNPIYVETKFWNVDTAFGLVSKEGLNPKFLHYFCLGFDFTLLNKSTTLPSLTKRNLSEIKIPLPPLPEQRRIVSKLDGLFAEIDASLALIDQNIEQAEALKLSVLDEEFGKIEDKKKLIEITKVIGGGTPRTKIPKYWGGEIVWLSPKDLPPIGVISEVSDSSRKITQLGLKKSSAKLLPKGAICYSSRASIGKIAIAEVELSTNQGFTNFICKEGVFNRYLAYVLRSLENEIVNLSNSTTFKEVSKTAFKNFKVPITNYKQQQKIVQKLDSLFEEIDGLISDYQQKRDNLEALKSSLLDRAFKGEL